MLGITIGLLGVLIAQPGPVPAETAAHRARVAHPTWPSSVRISGGEMVVVVATTPPTPLPTAAPAPTSTTPLPDCATAVAGGFCAWAMPSPTLIPGPPVCDTTAPGERCQWPTPTTAALPHPPPAGFAGRQAAPQARG